MGQTYIALKHHACYTMIVPYLILVALIVILYQFRGLFTRMVNLSPSKQDKQETKILDDLNIKRLCVKCGEKMEGGRAHIQFWNRYDRLASSEVMHMFRSMPDPLPFLATEPFQHQIDRDAYYCSKCQLFELS
jgi:hypothetical protein